MHNLVEGQWAKEERGAICIGNDARSMLGHIWEVYDLQTCGIACLEFVGAELKQADGTQKGWLNGACSGCVAYHMRGKHHYGAPRARC